MEISIIQKRKPASPINAHLIAMIRPQMNIVICDKYFQARYIAKYAAGADDKGQVSVKPGNSQNQFRITAREPQNKKIAGVAKRVEMERKTGFTRGYICITECVWHLFDLRFVPILPQWRQFARNQIRTVENKTVDVSTDKISIFGARTDSLCLFISCFTLFKLPKATLERHIRSRDYLCICCFGKQWKIKENRIGKVGAFAEKFQWPSANYFLQFLIVTAPT